MGRVIKLPGMGAKVELRALHVFKDARGFTRAAKTNVLFRHETSPWKSINKSLFLVARIPSIGFLFSIVARRDFRERSRVT